MRVTAPVLHPAEQERRAVLEPHSPRVEDRMGGIRPVGRRQDGILFMTPEKDLVPALQTHGFIPRLTVLIPPSPSAEYISVSASRNESVDSAPWFAFIVSGCNPSRQPPVVAS